MINDLRIGLKLWSTNDYYIRPAMELFEKKYFDYIELYAIPGSYAAFSGKWKELQVPFNIHAPHFNEGMNLAKKENEKKNLEMAFDALRFADVLKATQVIFHPGVEGDTNETIRQIKLINDDRVLVENKPYISVDGKYVCNGHSVEEIRKILAGTGAGFCLDFGHAVCAANSLKIDPIKNIREFISLRPNLYHLTDGDYKSPFDRHMHYGQGNFPLKELFSMVPSGSSVTNEAVKDSKVNLDDFQRDMDQLKKLI
jgi:deoxyribonuclease IV